MDTKRNALLAMALLIAFEVVTTGLFALEHGVPWLRRVPAIPLAVVLFAWIAPFLVVYRVEKRDTTSLGLPPTWRGYLRHVPLALAGLVLPAILTGIDRSLITELADQTVYIAVPEEIFNRGYVMTRLCERLGKYRGLLLNAVIFGLSHVASRVGQHGLQYAQRTALLGVQAFFGGLLFRYVYLRTKSIIPSMILHMAGNAFLSRWFG